MNNQGNLIFLSKFNFIFRSSLQKSKTHIYALGLILYIGFGLERFAGHLTGFKVVLYIEHGLEITWTTWTQIFHYTKKF